MSSNKETQLSESDLKNLYIVLPGNRISYQHRKYSGDSANNIFECTNPRDLQGPVRDGVLMRLDVYFRNIEADASEQKRQAEENAKKLHKEAEQKIEQAKAKIESVKTAALPTLKTFTGITKESEGDSEDDSEKPSDSKTQRRGRPKKSD